MRPVFAIFAAIAVSVVCAQSKITTAKQFFGHEVCEDYWLANYQQLSAYWRKLEKESARIRIVSIGRSEEGREQLMAIITDPRNHRNLNRIRKTNGQLALASGIADEQSAIRIIRKAPAVVWIDGGLHATEVLGAQQLLQTAYDLVSRNDEENKRILKDCIVLLAHANPDGMDLVSNWYMRRSDPSKRSLEGVPVLYQKYAGHDNNRDFFASNLAETKNINKVFYEEWFPQIVYNHHQSAPSGTIMFIPPFRNPFNYHVDPIAQIGIDTAGLHMHQRLIGEGLGGTVMRNGAPYSGWWNGGLRTTTYFHNMIGILTETWGSPNPVQAPFIKERQIPNGDLPKPLDVRMWHLRDSLQYEVGANYALLDYASRYRERLILDQYRMARNNIERGSRDHWKRTSARINSLGAIALSDPLLRDPRAYVMPIGATQASVLNRFAEMLIRCGIKVHRLTSSVGKWPNRSLIVRCDQPFRAHILDMFEPQEYPNDFQYPGGPPIAPYDSAGYTPAFTMGIAHDRVLDGTEVSQLTNHLEIVSLSEVTEQRYEYKADPTDKTPKVALWDRYGGSMPSGWTRYLFEQYKVPYEVLFASDIHAGKLSNGFDALVLVSGAIPARNVNRDLPLQSDPTIPLHLRIRMEPVTLSTTLPKLKEFVENGGQIIAVGSSALNLATHWNLPVESALTEMNAEGRAVELPNTKFYIPGSVLQIQTLPGPLTRGMPGTVDVMFDDSPAFRIKGNSGATPVAIYATDAPLRSGWAWGQDKLKGAAAIVDVSIGKGNVVLVGPEITFRAQTYASFPFLFNAILR